MGQLRVHVLGPLEISTGAGDEPIRLHSRKLQGLLAYLAACPGTGRPRETLATLLWDRSAEEQARASLRQALAVLRKAINSCSDESVLVIDHDRVALLADAVWVDAIEFQRLVAAESPDDLQRAVTLYRGRFLEGLGVDSNLFEDWVRAEGQRLQDLAMSALVKLLAHHREKDKAESAIETAHRILAIDPLHDEAHRALIALYVRQGARGEALRQYDRYRSVLRREFGIEPDAATTRLVRQLASAGQASVAVTPGPAPPEASTGRADSASGFAPQRSDEDEPAVEPRYGSSRRFATLMSCNLADVAAMSGRLDPEDWGRVIGAFRACCERVVGRHGGYVLHHLDASVSVCFGYPEAEEHAAERAVRAALEIVAEVGRLTSLPEPKLRARIGIASGWIVATEKDPTVGPREATIAGAEAVVVVALQAAAAPDSVLVAQSTKSLLGTFFDCEDLGLTNVAGLDVPVHAWRVLGERPGQGRFAAMRGDRALTPFVGREEEIQLLRRRWQRAREGCGQVVVLAGEPGIGKSRLIEMLRTELRDQAHADVAFYCSPHHQGSTLYPVIQQLERAAGYARDDAPTTKLDKLEALLTLGAHDPSGAPLIADLLTIPAGDRYPPLELAPQRQKERTLQVLEAQLVGLTQRHPALVIFEDFHWSDPTTREFLDRLVELAQRLPVLMIVTVRSGTQIPRSDESHVSSLVVKRLERSDSEALARSLVGKLEVPNETLATIADKGDGIPLFIEELTKYTLEAGTAGERGKQEASARRFPAHLSIPDRLHDLLVARLDRLGQGKTAAQEAAAIGRRFSYWLLASVSSLKEPQLGSALARLIDAGLVYVQGVPPSANYRFKHALVRDAAYASLLRSDRALLHGRIARALEEGSPETVEMEPDALAEHFAQSGLTERAVVYWQRAAELALRRSAQREAIAFLGEALQALESLPPTVQRNRQELALQVLLGQAWMLAAGYAAPTVEAAYVRARDLCEELGDSQQLFFVLLGLWQLYVARGEMAPARATVERLLPLAVSQNNRDFAVEAHVALCVTRHTEGALEDGLAHAHEAIALHDPTGREQHIRTFGYDGYLIALSAAAWAQWMLGYPDQGLQLARAALAAARSLGHPYSQAMVFYSAAWLHLLRGEADVACALAEESMALSAERGFVWPHAYAAPVAGWAMTQVGRAVEGIETIRYGLAALEQMGHRLWRPHQLGLLAAACARAGQTEEALVAVAQALEEAARTGDVENEAELSRLQGELTLRRAGPSAKVNAERCFKQAIEIARRQCAKSWELRAATSLGKLLRDQHRSDEGRGALEPVYDWFTEGFDTPDLREAAALLAELTAATAADGTVGTEGER